MKLRAVGIVLIFAIVLASPFLVAIGRGEAFKGAPNIDKQLVLPEGTKCSNTYDADYMVANHPNILKEEREKAVREGIRDKTNSLKHCFDCHTDKAKFCDTCHTSMGVKPGCFAEAGGCHFAPTSKKSSD